MARPFQRPADIPQCSTCHREMDLTVIIPPFGSPYGLKVYTCPKCGRSQIISFTRHRKQRSPLIRTLPASPKAGAGALSEWREIQLGGVGSTP